MNLSITILLLSAAAVNAQLGQPNGLGAMGCNGNGLQCSMNIGGLDLRTNKDDIVEIDLGQGRRFACTSMGASQGRFGATLHAECAGADGGTGAMNMVPAGTDAAGEKDLVMGTVAMDDKI